jgi:hypothetical protein
MGWSYGEVDGRDVGYGVPAYCDHPDCKKEIDRGLGYICGYQQVGGGDQGCGNFFCSEHGGDTLCERCMHGNGAFPEKPDHPKWLRWKLEDGSWEQWRAENPEAVKAMRAALADAR